MFRKIKETTAIVLTLCSTPLSAHAFDLVKLRCVRQDREGQQIFLSEIHFRRLSRSITDKYEGEVISYSLKGTEKTYVSGYNLFSIGYRDQVISGLTGDPITHADGSFSLARISDKNSGVWKFSYTNTTGYNIDADFKCIYRN